MLRQEFRRGLAVLSLALVGACATPSGPPPVVTIGGQPCTSTPNLLKAETLVFVPKKPKPLIKQLDAGFPCVVDAAGTRSIYAIFALPEANPPYIISVSSNPQWKTLFPPHVELLSEDGARIRDIPNDLFLFRGSALKVEIRSHVGERYLLVRSVPELIGKEITRISAVTSATAMSTGTATFTMYSGSDVTTKLTFGYNGQLEVSLLPLPAGK